MVSVYNIRKQRKQRKQRKKMNIIEIPHIGEVLNEEFLEPMGMSQNKLAKAIGVPQNRINAIINKF